MTLYILPRIMVRCIMQTPNATLLDYDLVAMNNISHSHCEASSPLGFFLHCKYWKMYIKRIKNYHGYREFEIGQNGVHNVGQAIPIKKPPWCGHWISILQLSYLKNSQYSFLTSPLTLNLDSDKYLWSLPIFNLLTLERFGYIVWHQCSCLNDGIFSCPIFFHIVNLKITQVVGYSWDVKFTTLVSDIEKILWTHGSLCNYLNF